MMPSMKRETASVLRSIFWTLVRSALAVACFYLAFVLDDESRAVFHLIKWGLAGLGCMIYSAPIVHRLNEIEAKQRFLQELQAAEKQLQETNKMPDQNPSK